MKDFREMLLAAIGANIENHGLHIYNIPGGQSPRFVYSIGLHEKFGFEVVLGGSITLPLDPLVALFNSLTNQLGHKPPEQTVLSSPEVGDFTLRATHPSWVSGLLLGAIDFYKDKNIKAYQLIPPEFHQTIDMPDMRQELTPQSAPVWRWMKGGWPYKVQADCLVETNHAALKGNPVTDVSYFGDWEWQMFAGDPQEVKDEDVFYCHLATLLAFDSTLEPALGLPVRTGLFRESDSKGPGPWHRVV